VRMLRIFSFSHDLRLQRQSKPVWDIKLKKSRGFD
jgi:hypothetical protein